MSIEEISSHEKLDTTIANTNNPYHLASCDNPNQLMSNIKMNGKNYQIWATHLCRVLSIKNKLSFIDGKLLEHNANDPKYNVWNRCNDLVISWITKSLNSTLQQDYLYHMSVAKLKVHYVVTSRLTRYELKRKLAQCNQEEDSIALYYTRQIPFGMSTSDNQKEKTCLCCVCMNETEEDKIIGVLGGLHDSYKTIRGNILMMTLTSTLDQIYQLLI